MEHPARDCVLIPVKSFDLAKGRLAGALSAERRRDLARAMATDVVRAAAPLPANVVCGSEEVARWAVGVGAGVIWYRPPGLNQAVTAAARRLGVDGYRRVVIAHGDLPLARDLAWVADFDGVTIVPDRRGEGTNVMAVPLGIDFTFRYGADSAPAHRAEAERLGLPVRVVSDDRLGWDVDTPDDLDGLPGGEAATGVQSSPDAARVDG